LEPLWLREEAVAAGLRIVGVDRPGYGLSTPRPGRSIADGVADLLAVADHLAIDQFVTVGVSTGGAYALATAALAPDRVLGVVACCAVTDMAFQPARATMHGPQVHAVWDAPTRDAAIAAASEAYGDDGNKLLNGGMNPVLAASDAALFADAAWMRAAMEGFPSMFAHGPQGYADDRIADGPGWTTFDVRDITCPVTVLHGDEDRLCVPIHAEHTAAIVPDAQLVMIPDAGHFSIERHVIPEIRRLLDRPR
jgi:pimeloyl-ACP methyl ester carboxylesterase